MSDRDLYELHVKRLGRIMDVAVAGGNEVIILGAFGCGAFENNPEVVARAAKCVAEKYRDFLAVSVSRVPDKLRIIAVERLLGQYVAGVNVDFSEETIPNISQCIKDTEEAGYAVFVDDRVGLGFFNIEDYYYIVLEAESTDKFIDLCNRRKCSGRNVFLSKGEYGRFAS